MTNLEHYLLEMALFLLDKTSRRDVTFGKKIYHKTHQHPVGMHQTKEQ